MTDPLDERRDAGPLSAAQSLDVLAVGADGHHAGAVRRIGTGVEQRLEIGAGARDEHDEACSRWGRHGAQSNEDRARSPTAPAGVVSRRRSERAARRCHQVMASPASSPPMPKAVIACTIASKAKGPTARIRPGPIAPPASAVRMPTNTPAKTPAAQPRSAPMSQRNVGSSRWVRTVATAATRIGSAISHGVQAGVGPGSGRAASRGNNGSGPSTTTVGETIVLAPNAKPGPRR